MPAELLDEALMRRVTATFFHGGPKREHFNDQKFDRDWDQDKNANGPGIYLTSLFSDAQSYIGTSGVVHTLEVKNARVANAKGSANRAFLSKLIDYAPEERREVGLSNWDENPVIAKQRALDSYAHEQHLNGAAGIYHDFYGHAHAAAFAAANVKAGVDAVEVKQPECTHLIVYNPKVLTVVKTERPNMNEARESIASRILDQLKGTNEPYSAKPQTVKDIAFRFFMGDDWLTLANKQLQKMEKAGQVKFVGKAKLEPGDEEPANWKYAAVLTPDEADGIVYLVQATPKGQEDFIRAVHKGLPGKLRLVPRNIYYAKNTEFFIQPPNSMTGLNRVATLEWKTGKGRLTRWLGKARDYDFGSGAWVIGVNGKDEAIVKTPADVLSAIKGANESVDSLSEETNGGSHMVKHYFDFGKMPGGMQASTGKHTDDARKVTKHPVITRIAAKLRLLWNKLNVTSDRKERMSIIRAAMGSDARYMKNESEIGDDAGLFEAGKKEKAPINKDYVQHGLNYKAIRTRTAVKPAGDGTFNVIAGSWHIGVVNNVNDADAEAMKQNPKSKIKRAGWSALFGHGDKRRVVGQGLKSKEDAVEVLIRASMKETGNTTEVQQYLPPPISEAGSADDDEADPANPDKNPQGQPFPDSPDDEPDGKPEPPMQAAPQSGFGGPAAPDASQSDYKAPKGKRDSGTPHDDERLKHAAGVQSQAGKINQKKHPRDVLGTSEDAVDEYEEADVQKVRAMPARKGRPKLLVPGSKRKASLESVEEAAGPMKEIEGVQPLPGLRYMTDAKKDRFNVQIHYLAAGEGQRPAILFADDVSAGLDGKLARQVVAEIANRTLNGVDWTKSVDEISADKGKFQAARAAWITAFTVEQTSKGLTRKPTKATLAQLPSKYPANLFA